MLKINLLKDKLIKKQTIFININPFIKFGIVVFINLFALSLIYFFLIANIKELRVLSQSNKNELNILKKRVSEIRDYEQANKELENKINIIYTLIKGYDSPSKIFDNIAKALPEGIWLNSLNYKDNKITLEGVAFTNENLIGFTDDLKKIPDIMDITIEESNRSEIDRNPVYKFRLNFRIKV